MEAQSADRAFPSFPPLKVEEQIDQICLRFEQDWRSGLRPCVQQYLGEIDEVWRNLLLHELTCVEQECRVGLGDLAHWGNYPTPYPPNGQGYDDASHVLGSPAPVAPILSHAASLPPRTQVGPFEILRELGRGGMGVVYEAVQSSLGRRVALKVLTPSGRSRTELDRFRREAAVAARLHHTNIVPVFEAGQDGGHLYYAMQFIPGRDLHAVLQGLQRLRQVSVSRTTPSALLTTQRNQGYIPAVPDQANSDHPVAWPDAAAESLIESAYPWPRDEIEGLAFFRRVAQIGLQVASALQYSHSQGAVHRDIKPTNLLLDPRGTVWITDFGLVKTSDSDLTTKGALIGTLRYLAPERLSGLCDHRSDVYSLGLTLYELVTLRPAFVANEAAHLLQEIASLDPIAPRVVESAVPRDLETIIVTAINKDPARRYQSADALGEDLRRFLQGEPVLARPVSMLGRVVKWAQRDPAVASLAATLVLALLLGIGFSTAFAVQAGEQAELAQKQAAQAEKSARQASENEHRATGKEKEVREALAQVGKERDATRRALRRAEGLRMIALSESLRRKNPGLALALGVAGAERAPGLLANLAMQEAMDECRERRTLVGHAGPVFHAAFSADGSKVVTCSADSTARVWEAATGRLLHVLLAPHVFRAGFSPDGRRIVTLSAEQFYRLDQAAVTNTTTLRWDSSGPTSRLWDATTGKLLFAWQPPRPKWAYNIYAKAGFAFSDDSRRVVTFFGMEPSGQATVHDASTGALVTTLKGRTPVFAAAFKPGGKTLATASPDGVQIWETETGNLTRSLVGHRCDVSVLAFSPDGGRLLSIGTGRKYCTTNGMVSQTEAPDDAAARIWEIESGKQVALLKWPAGNCTPFSAGAFTPNGSQVTLAGGSHSRQTFDARTGEPVPQQKWTDEFMAATRWARATIGPDGRSVLYQGADVVARLLTPRGPVELRGHDHAVVWASFRPDGRQVVTGSADGTARLWDVPPEDSPDPLGYTFRSHPAILTPDGGKLFVRPPSPACGLLIDTTTRHELARLEFPVLEAVLCADGRQILATSPNASKTDRIRAVALDTATGKVSPYGSDLQGHLCEVSRDGSLALVAGHTSGRPDTRKWKADIYRMRGGKTALEGILLSPNSSIQGDFSRDGRRLMTTTEDFPMIRQVWDVSTGKELFRLDSEKDKVAWAAFAGSGGDVIVLNWKDGERFSLLDSATGKRKRGFTDKTLRALGHAPGGFPADRVRLFHLDAEGQRLLCSPYDPVAAVWDLRGGPEPSVVLTGHAGAITFCRFSPDGQFALTGSEDRTARVWDIRKGEATASVFRGHQGAVTWAALDPAGKRLVTASSDATIRVWDVATTKELARLPWRHLPVREAAFTPDGRRVCILGFDVARIWDIDILAAAKARMPRVLTREEREYYEVAGDEVAITVSN